MSTKKRPGTSASSVYDAGRVNSLVKSSGEALRYPQNKRAPPMMVIIVRIEICFAFPLSQAPSIFMILNRHFEVPFAH